DLDDHLVLLRLDPSDAAPPLELGASRARRRPQRGHCGVGADRARLRVVEYLRLEAHARPAPLRLGSGERFDRNAAGRQGASERLVLGGVAVVDEPAELEERRAALLLELAPG